MRLGFVFTLLFACSTYLHAQPKIQIAGGTKLEFGDVNRGTNVEKKLTIKNVGTETLVLGKVDVSCGCTGSVVSKESIPPGESGTVVINFNSTNFSGPVHKTVTINSNAKDAPATVVEFTANVIEELNIDPRNLWFKDAQVGVVSTITMTIKNNGKEPLKLTGYKTELQGFTMKVPKEPIAPGKSGQLVAEFNAPAARPILSDGVFIETSSKNQPQLYIQIFGNVKEFKFQ